MRLEMAMSATKSLDFGAAPQYGIHNHSIIAPANPLFTHLLHFRRLKPYKPFLSRSVTLERIDPVHTLLPRGEPYGVGVRRARELSSVFAGTSLFSRFPSLNFCLASSATSSLIAMEYYGRHCTEAVYQGSHELVAAALAESFVALVRLFDEKEVPAPQHQLALITDRSELKIHMLVEVTPVLTVGEFLCDIFLQGLGILDAGVGRDLDVDYLAHRGATRDVVNPLVVDVNEVTDIGGVLDEEAAERIEAKLILMLLLTTRRGDYVDHLVERDVVVAILVEHAKEPINLGEGHIGASEDPVEVRHGELVLAVDGDKGLEKPNGKSLAAGLTLAKGSLSAAPLFNELFHHDEGRDDGPDEEGDGHLDGDDVDAAMLFGVDERDKDLDDARDAHGDDLGDPEDEPDSYEPDKEAEGPDTTRADVG
ncbi:serine/threonine protein kinase [Zalerion maritima]|uniref:Serine/threonine protein kinase n=1 Tax=Zalerion maritima TaxID=339359 RepID=A0AAD5RSK0_9PEZI|nr:serine/threonine protein kinase [Zalerion maritima]